MSIPSFSLSLWLERIQGMGEDSNPLIRKITEESGIVAVFDGLGGSGSTKYNWEGESYTGAYFASRIAKALLATYIKRENSNYSFGNREWVFEYEQALIWALSTAHKSLDKNPSKLKSSLIRPLPTTLSGIYFKTEGEKVKCQSLNAGDSRSYILHSDFGLSQVTHDDIISASDAFQTLYESTRMANCLSADGKCRINVLEFECALPIVLLAASDGCFDYVQTPAHFEFLLLDHMQQSESIGDWAKRLSSAFRSIAGDDVSLGMLAIGWKDFYTLKNAFSNRFTQMKDKFIQPLEAIISGVENEVARDNLRVKLWDEYRVNYYRMIQFFNNPIANEKR